MEGRREGLGKGERGEVRDKGGMGKEGENGEAGGISALVVGGTVRRPCQSPNQQLQRFTELKADTVHK